MPKTAVKAPDLETELSAALKALEDVARAEDEARAQHADAETARRSHALNAALGDPAAREALKAATAARDDLAQTLEDIEAARDVGQQAVETIRGVIAQKAIADTWAAVHALGERRIEQISRAHEHLKKALAAFQDYVATGDEARIRLLNMRKLPGAAGFLPQARENVITYTGDDRQRIRNLIRETIPRELTIEVLNFPPPITHIGDYGAAEQRAWTA